MAKKIFRTNDANKLIRLTDKKAGVVSINLYRGIQTFKKRISDRELEEAWQNGNWGKVMHVIPWNDLPEDISPALAAVGGATLAAGKISIEALPPNVNSRLRWDANNPVLRKYITDRTAKLVVGINQETQQIIQNSVARSFTHALVPRDVAKLIKKSIGLYPAQNVALTNYQMKLMADGKTGDKLESLVNRYEDKLLDYRSRMIARTEMRGATNMGQVSVWREAANQDLIDRRTAEREWVAEGPDPCPECDEMDGERVGIDEPFIMGDGSVVDTPPWNVHPNCYCSMILVI